MEDSDQKDIPETTVQESLAHAGTDLDRSASRRRLLVPVAALLVIIVGALMTIKASVQKESRLNLAPVELTEGAELPDFTLTRLDGSKLQVSELKHKVIMLNFWATWCEACMEEMPSIVKLREAYQAQGFEVIGLNVDENPTKAVPPTENKFGMKFPTFKDPENTLTELFDIHAIPLTVIFDQNRKILMIESGSREWDSEEMQQLVQKWTSAN
jgi:thiol-disulfide isomerase/thioredoxin